MNIFNIFVWHQIFLPEILGEYQFHNWSILHCKLQSSKSLLQFLRNILLYTTINITVWYLMNIFFYSYFHTIFLRILSQLSHHSIKRLVLQHQTISFMGPCGHNLFMLRKLNTKVQFSGLKIGYFLRDGWGLEFCIFLPGQVLIACLLSHASFF